MTPRERVERALRFRSVDKVGFTMYTGHISERAGGRVAYGPDLCVAARLGTVKTIYRDVTVTSKEYLENGENISRTEYATPHGILWMSSVKDENGMSWRREKLFKGPEDYKRLLALIQSERYEPCFENVRKAEEIFGDHGVFRGNLGLEPLQALISGQYMDMTTFCYEWMDRRDEILKLYDALVESRRRLYPIAAEAPVSHFNYGGNIVPTITSPEDYEAYYLPHYREAAEILRKKGKLLGSHYDDDMKSLAANVAKAPLDYIEALTPAPDTAMTLRECRDAWPDKVLWLNFPSSLHLKSDEELADITVNMLDSLENIGGLIMGVTEDIPEYRQPFSCRAIMDGLTRHARTRPNFYGGE